MKTPKIWAFLPFALFIGLFAMFAFGMWGNRVSKDTSPLIGQPAPTLQIFTIDNQIMDLVKYRGKPIIVNFFASWCAPCRAEHPSLLQIGHDESVVLIGIAYRDNPTNNRNYIEQLGNPFAQIGLDLQGAAGASFGLSGVPETYIIDKDGIIIYKHKGEITAGDVPKLIRIAVRGS
ncbi:MAG: cytochrome c bioproteinis protein CcmG thiol:disulfide interchange protein DsbE [Hyphomonadaceae bacterium]|nr:MAG: cytochrome c bioproteinis protein CcmG thiol:disulfide interchange protein DsbE [Hyphomonadaceae bacterium]KAF0186854.1 MAG: cytochrome c bioproteinis protein CcmG thiol:disulfide interchange protein DsbE [Hyphomonadaceae bacterium]